MASKREVTVVINGEEYVSKAAKEAEAGMTGFAGFMERLSDKLIPVIDVTKLVEVAVRALTTAFNAAKQFVMDSIGAYDAYVSAQVKLAAQSKLTGVSMKDMNALVDTARSNFGLGTVAAVDIAAAVAKFASQSGQAARAGELMAAALELGAASGQNAAKVAEGLSSALAGNDEWLNQLGLANPSGIWQDYAEANGLAVSKMSDTEKKLAVMTALIDAGNKVTGVYAERIESAAGQQDRLNNNMDEARRLFGAAIQPIRVLVIQGLTSLLNVIGPLVIALGYLASGVVNALVAPFKLAQSAIGSVVEVTGRLTGNKALEEWGKKNASAFKDFIGEVEDWMQLTKPATKAVEDQGKAHQLATVQITASKDATEKHTKASKDLEAAYKPLYVALGMTKGALESLAQSARDQLPPKPAQDFNAAMDSIRQNADALIAKFPPINANTKSAADNTRDMAREVEQMARGAIDAASSFGVIDDKAARSLNSAVNIASAIGGMAKHGFSFSGVTGVIGGVASLVSVMMQGDVERRRLTKENTQALEKLRTEGVRLSNRASGEQIAGITQALGGADLNALSAMSKTPGGNRAVTSFLASYLAKMGLRLSDLDAVASELGISLRRSDGTIDGTQLPFLLTALTENANALTSIPQTFGSQLEFFKQSQNISGATGTTKIGGLLDFLTGGAGNIQALQGINLSDPTAARSQLVGLLTQLNNGGLAPALLGRATGEQFRTILMELIGLIDDLSADTGSGGGSSGGSGSVDVGSSGNLVSGGTSVPVSTVQDVIKAMDTNIAGILTTHTAIHERIAAATEGSHQRLISIDAKMDQLIVVTAERIDATDAKLEAMRRMSQLERGVRPVLTP